MRRALVALLFVAACSSGGGGAAKTVHITYQVRGFANFPTITYRTPTGEVTRHSGTDSSQQELTEDIGIDVKVGDPVALTVESTFLGDQGVTCIIVGSSGQEIAKNSAPGQKVKASCEGKAA